MGESWSIKLQPPPGSSVWAQAPPRFFKSLMAPIIYINRINILINIVNNKYHKYSTK